MKEQLLHDAERMMRGVGNSLISWRSERELRSYGYKRGKEVVSEFDSWAESSVRGSLRSLLPKYKIWGEELGRDAGDLAQDNFVIIDALDGTKNYLSGNPLFASQIAVFENGRCAWSMVNLPALEELYVAIRGEGAFCNGLRIGPSTQDRLDLALQCFGIGHDAQNFLNLPTLIGGLLAEPRHYGSSGVHHAFLACGRTDIYIAAEAAYYDSAPGILLCREAGLSFCTLRGGLYEENEQSLSVVIGNAALIEQYKAAVRQ